MSNEDLAVKVERLEDQINSMEKLLNQMLSALVEHDKAFDRAYGNLLGRLTVLESYLKPHFVVINKDEGAGGS